MKNSFYQCVIVALITLAIIIGHTGRELLPSEHGLAYQYDASSPTHNGDAQEMLSFFGSTTALAPLPEAQNVGNDTWWSVQGNGSSRDITRARVSVGLIMATTVCGIGGVVLLVVSGIVFVVRRQKQKAEAERLSPNTELHAINDK